MRVFIFIIIFLIAGGMADAQLQVVSLEKSRQSALAYSNAIKNGQLRIGAAEAGIAAAKSDYLPSVSGIGAGLYGFKDFVPAIPGILENGINNFYLVGVTAMQPLYAGGRIQTGNKLAAIQLEVDKILARQSIDSVLLLVEQKYWNIVNLQEQDKVLTVNEESLNSVLKMQEDMLAAGLIARNDMLKVKVQLSRLLVNKSKTQNYRRLALFDFSLYTGLAYDSMMVMLDTLNKSVYPVMPSLQPDTTLTNIAGYQLLSKQVEAETLQTKLTKGDYLPNVSVGLSAAQVGTFNSGLGSSFVPTALATVSVPISEGLWGRGKQKMRQRKIKEQIVQNDFSDGRDKLQVNVMKTWYDLKDGLTQISYARENLALATENLKVSQDNYKSGLSTISDVLDAQSAYQQAAAELNTAYTNFEMKKAVYEFAIGKISMLH